MHNVAHLIGIPKWEDNYVHGAHLTRIVNREHRYFEHMLLGLLKENKGNLST